MFILCLVGAFKSGFETVIYDEFPGSSLDCDLKAQQCNLWTQEKFQF